MPQPVPASEIQHKLPKTVLDLQRIIRRLRRHQKRLGVTGEMLCAYYDSGCKQPRSPEREAAERIDINAEELEDIAKNLQKVSELTDELVRQRWRENRDS